MMKRAILLFLFCAMPLFADEKPADDVSVEARTAIEALKVGMEEWQVVALLRPVSIEFGRVTYGGSGAGCGYFRISETRQVWVAFGGFPSFLAESIGQPEPLGTWKPDYHPVYYTPRPPPPPLRIDRYIEDHFPTWKHDDHRPFLLMPVDARSK